MIFRELRLKFVCIAVKHSKSAWGILSVSWSFGEVFLILKNKQLRTLYIANIKELNKLTLFEIFKIIFPVYRRKPWPPHIRGL